MINIRILPVIALALPALLLCAAKQADIPHSIDTEMQADMTAKDGMYQELVAGGADTAAIPYNELSGYLAAMRNIAAKHQGKNGTARDVLLQESDKYIALSEKVDVFMETHGITRLDIRTTEKQVYAFLRSISGSIDEVENGIRENRQRMYDNGSGDASETGQALAGLDKLKKAMDVKTTSIKKIIDTINNRAMGMKTVWIGPGTALGSAMDDITALTDDLNGLSGQVHTLQQKLQVTD